MSIVVLITGANGYIGQHIVKLLLEKNYIVIGSVRSSEKGEKLKHLLNSDKFSYEVIETIERKDAFPFFFNVADVEKDLLIPAIEGTRNALKAIQKLGPQITRVVITSSYSSQNADDKDNDPSLTIDETSWNSITYEESITDPYSGYDGSKTLAENLAWNFVEAEGPKFSLSTVNPVCTFEPHAFKENVKSTLNQSAEVINEIVKSAPYGSVYNHGGAYIDVRDVAKAHITAFESDAAKDKRLFLTAGRFTSQTLYDIINENFPSLKGKIISGKPRSDIEVIKGLTSLNNESTKRILGFECIPLKKTVIDTVQQILDADA